MHKSQTTNTLLMIEPVAFAKNAQTEHSNRFQKSLSLNDQNIQKAAHAEFLNLVKELRSKGVNVMVVKDTEHPHTPDSIFPNNWISFHSGKIAVYPMEAKNRRAERREDVLNLVEKNGIPIHEVVDYTGAEEEEVYLEGTGSMVLDRVHKKAYCSISSRSNEDLFIDFCEDFEYDPVLFSASIAEGEVRTPVYHTNVMMSVGQDFAVVCFDAIADKKEKKNLLKHLQSTGKEIISITESQVKCFAGNMLEVKGENERLLVMSSQARASLTQDQLQKLQKKCYLLDVPLQTIETLGGGSARCMLAEVF